MKFGAMSAKAAYSESLHFARLARYNGTPESEIHKLTQTVALLTVKRRCENFQAVYARYCAYLTYMSIRKVN